MGYIPQIPPNLLAHNVAMITQAHPPYNIYIAMTFLHDFMLAMDNDRSDLLSSLSENNVFILLAGNT